MLRPGSSVGGHDVIRLLGDGGMGAVYLARHPRWERNVALKVLHDGFAADPLARLAFERETQLASTLRHPNIVPVLDSSRPDDARLWRSMRYIDGGDVSGLLSDEPDGVHPDRALRLITDAAQGLDHAHRQGILHRDVKPADILLDREDDGRAMLTDFGIAQVLAAAAAVSGVNATFAYAAPERLAGSPTIDRRADVYSLGCLLFELLTGIAPFPGDSAAGAAGRRSGTPPSVRERRSTLPSSLDLVIGTALAQDPADRYPTCAALADDAARAIAGTSVAARPKTIRPTPSAEPETLYEFKPSAIISLGFALFGIVGFLFLTYLVIYLLAKGEVVGNPLAFGGAIVWDVCSVGFLYGGASSLRDAVALTHDEIVIREGWSTKVVARSSLRSIRVNNEDKTFELARTHGDDIAFSTSVIGSTGSAKFVKIVEDWMAR